MKTAAEWGKERGSTQKDLDWEFGKIIALPGRPLSGMAVVLVQDGETVYEGHFGARRFLTSCEGALEHEGALKHEGRLNLKGPSNRWTARRGGGLLRFPSLLRRLASCILSRKAKSGWTKMCRIISVIPCATLRSLKRR